MAKRVRACMWHAWRWYDKADVFCFHLLVRGGIGQAHPSSHTQVNGNNTHLLNTLNP